MAFLVYFVLILPALCPLLLLLLLLLGTYRPPYPVHLTVPYVFCVESFLSKEIKACMIELWYSSSIVPIGTPAASQV